MFDARAAVAATLVVVLGGSAQAQAQSSGLQWSGYAKNLLMCSDTWSGEPFTLDVNRLRVAVKGSIAPRVSVDLQYDNELLLGNYLRTAQFQQRKDVSPPPYGRADANYLEAPRLYGTHRLYRATLSLAAGDTDLRIGRQRVAWGTGRFWSPLDVLNPVSPIALERDERLGVDSLLVERKFGALSRLAGVYAPSRSGGRSTAALQWHDNISGLDYSLIAGRLLGQQTWGLDLAGQVGPAGVRAELTRQQTDGLPAYTRAMAGADYAFGNTLTLTGELYFNGAGARETSAYDFSALMSGELQALARRYLGLHAGYDITPLLKWDSDLVVNIDDHSNYLATSLGYLLRTNLELRLGVQRFSGAPGTEYARVPNTGFVQLQRFF